MMISDDPSVKIKVQKKNVFVTSSYNILSSQTMCDVTSLLLPFVINLHEADLKEIYLILNFDGSFQIISMIQIVKIGYDVKYQIVVLKIVGVPNFYILLTFFTINNFFYLF